MVPQDSNFHRAVLEAAPSGMMVLEQRADSWPVVYFNPAFALRLADRTQNCMDRDWRLLFADNGDLSSLARLQSQIDARREAREVVRHSSSAEGRASWSELHLSPFVQPGSPDRYIGLLRDVTEERALREQLERHAMYDELSGLANRRQFQHRLANAIASAQAEPRRFALLLLDLDGFKSINDFYGHAAGDEVLREIGTRLRTVLGGDGIAARLGGDEFGILLEPADDPGHVSRFIGALPGVLCRPVAFGRLRISVGCSVGLSWFPNHGVCPANLMAHADADMYRHKWGNRSRRWNLGAVTRLLDVPSSEIGIRGSRGTLQLDAQSW